jgi:hypothetical protein
VGLESAEVSSSSSDGGSSKDDDEFYDATDDLTLIETT